MSLKGNAATGWQVTGPLGIAAGSTPAYSMFCWFKTVVSPAAESVLFCWGGAGGVHSEIIADPANFYLGWDFDDALAFGVPVAVPAANGVWLPVLWRKTNQSLRELRVGNDFAGGTETSVLTTQTLTHFYIGQDETSVRPLLATQAIAEVAVWLGTLGDTEAKQVMSGYCPLRIAPNKLVFYAPLRFDLVDYSSASRPIAGAKPTFSDHPPVEDYIQVLSQDGICASQSLGFPSPMRSILVR